MDLSEVWKSECPSCFLLPMFNPQIIPFPTSILGSTYNYNALGPSSSIKLLLIFKNMIISVISGYQDAEFLENAINSVIGMSDRIIYVDGRYVQFGGDNAPVASIDGSISLARSLGAEVVECGNIPWESQVYKRNQYLLGEEGDYYLMIDADEEFEGKLEFGNDIAYRIFQVDKQKNISIPWIRLFRHTKTLKYYGAHNILWNNGKIIREEETNILFSCKINHYYFKRTKERINQRQQYYGLQYDLEKEFRTKHKCP